MKENLENVVQPFANTRVMGASFTSRDVTDMLTFVIPSRLPHPHAQAAVERPQHLSVVERKDTLLPGSLRGKANYITVCSNCQEKITKLILDMQTEALAKRKR